MKTKRDPPKSRAGSSPSALSSLLSLCFPALQRSAGSGPGSAEPTVEGRGMCQGRRHGPRLGFRSQFSIRLLRPPVKAPGPPDLCLGAHTHSALLWAAAYPAPPAEATAVPSCCPLGSLGDLLEKPCFPSWDVVAATVTCSHLAGAALGSCRHIWTPPAAGLGIGSPCLQSDVISSVGKTQGPQRCV